MKHVTVAGKALTLLFTAAFLAACGSTDTQEDTSAAEAAAERARIEAQQADEARIAEEQRQQRMLEDEAERVGNIFYFEFDSSTLKPEAQAALDKHIALLKTSDKSVRLEGHTDERGTREYNLALGERRANSVRDYMVVNGIASYRIETVSYGEEQPEAYGSGEANWSQNRRVVLK
ncbi:peptidoglycan-associated lipoprotein Pal [Parahaliea mediterranea]|uniref:Peptidoglycan-associated lipoprotein n=1 Tax=Parahaliea mediterranea TaxID=651086 RepID=A0A939DHW7_9GAMM|nr:peptidoglycan-associated lipoprotein Pal [Parahaliea mediterranea]MBN7798574.1 peptidoglycan-associated lipoprotein Pal [Parahaliea mediterranea]